MEGNFVYRFIDDGGEILYVGCTHNLIERLKGHDHLPKDCYAKTKHVEFQTFNTNADMFLYEVYYINKLKPFYNKASMGNGKLNVELEEGEWEEIPLIKKWGEYVPNKVKVAPNVARERIIRANKRTVEILSEYDGKLISYSVEKELLRKTSIGSRFDLIQYYQKNGYFIKWVNKYNAKGKKLFIPIKNKGNV